MVTKAKAMSRPPRYDIAVADFRKNANERVRVTLHEFNGMDLVNLRVWLDPGGGHDVSKMVPTAKGVTLNVELLPKLCAAISEAVTVANEKGLIPARNQSVDKR